MDDTPEAARPKPTPAAPSLEIGSRIVFGAAVVGLLVIGGGGWAATADLSGAVIAPGALVVDRHVKRIQHLDGGIIAEIKVRDGDIVDAGQLLVRLDPTQTRAELAILESQLAELAARRLRLEAEREGRNELVIPEDLRASTIDAASAGGSRAMLGELRLFNETVRTRESQKEQMRSRIGQFDQEARGLEAQLRGRIMELKLVDTELRQTKDLADRGLTPKTRVYTLEREAARLTGENGSLSAQIARIKGQVSEINLQLLNLDQSARMEAQRELRTVEARIGELAERRLATRDRLERMEVRAPQEGIVHELAVHTVGGVITPAAQILSIVPKHEQLAIEVRLAPVDIDQVSIGQPARLRFSAFNHRETEEVTGRVIHVSADVSHDGRATVPYYLARIALSDDARKTLGGAKLLPGMPVEAFITTSERKAMSYLFKPIVDQFTRAFKEQ